MTMSVTRWTPAGNLASLEIDRLNRMFGAVFGDETFSSGGWTPAVDIFETADKDVVVKVELPDVKRDDIKLTLENSVLTIEGERKFDAEVKREQYHRVERAFGAFRRSFTLPASVDAGRVDATFQDGVLTIRIPQRAEAKPREIAIG